MIFLSFKTNKQSVFTEWRGQEQSGEGEYLEALARVLTETVVAFKT